MLQIVQRSSRSVVSLYKTRLPDWLFSVDNEGTYDICK